MAEKVWDAHVVRSAAGEPDLLYIDLHLLHEATSPQAFDGLRAAGRKVRRPDLTLATRTTTPRPGTTTRHRRMPAALFTIADLTSRLQIETLRRNCAEFGIRLHSLGDANQGIVHVIGPSWSDPARDDGGVRGLTPPPTARSVRWLWNRHQ